MNRHGGIISFTILFFFLVFIMWPFVLAPLLGVGGDQATASGATGLDGFIWNNWNLWFFLIFIIVGAVYFTFGGGQR
jgi:hypothetical protein